MYVCIIKIQVPRAHEVKTQCVITKEDFPNYKIWKRCNHPKMDR